MRTLWRLRNAWSEWTRRDDSDSHVMYLSIITQARVLDGVVSVILNLAPGRIVASGGTSESTLIRPHLGNTDSAPSWRAIISRAAQNLDYTSCMHTSIGSTTQIPQSPSPLTTNQFHLENFHLSDLPA